MPRFTLQDKNGQKCFRKSKAWATLQIKLFTLDTIREFVNVKTNYLNVFGFSKPCCFICLGEESPLQRTN